MRRFAGARLYESLTGTVCAEFIVPRSVPPQYTSPKFICFGADGRTVVLAGEHHSIWSWDVATGRRLPTFAEGEKRPHALIPVPHSNTLLVATSGGNITLWALPKPPEPTQPAKPPTDEDFGRLWADLSEADAAKAFRAIQTLRSHPEQAAPFLRARVRLLPADDLGRIRELVGALDADTFRVRAKAVAELVRIGDKARPALRLAYAREGASPELRQRAEEVYDKLKGRGPTGDYLRALRAVRILRSIGTADARAALEELAKGPAEDGIADEARGALKPLGDSSKRE